VAKHPEWFSLEKGCAIAKQDAQYLPPSERLRPEECGNDTDEDCDGVAAGCNCTDPATHVVVGSYATVACGLTADSRYWNTGVCRQGSMTCGFNGYWTACNGAIGPSPETLTCAPGGGGDHLDNDCDGVIDNGCPEVCGDGGDNNGNGLVDEGCGMSDAPPAEACFEPPASTDSAAQSSVAEVNAGCANGDFAGYDPINLSARSATTEPFTDFEVAVLRPLGVTRSYSSGDVMAGGAAGIFGLGWHHQWETTLTCSGNGVSCTVSTPGGKMQFMSHAAATVIGVGALSGETLVLYRRTEAANLAYGGMNLMVRRATNGEFILFRLDGSELHFAQPASCGSYCMDGSHNGTLRLSRDIDASGRAVQLDFTEAGTLFTLTDDLANQVRVTPSTTCGGRAGAVAYRPAGRADLEATYVTYEYDGTCSTLSKVIPASYTPAPGKKAQLRSYEYKSSPRAGLLTTIRNEFGDPVVVFGYDAAGNATTLVDSESSLSVTYPQGATDVVVSAYGALQSTTTHYRASSGKAGTVDFAPGFTTAWDEYWTTSQQKMVWNGRYLTCSEDMGGRYTRYFERDAQNRVKTISDYGATPFATSGIYPCKDAPWPRTLFPNAAPLRTTTFEYGITRSIAQGVTLDLEIVTRSSRPSVFGAQLAAAAAGGASASNFQTSETLDYDPTRNKPGDPPSYDCGTSNLPAGGLVCRRYVDGYTYDANGKPTLQRVGTFFSYDGRGRLVRTHGPIYLIGSPPPGNVDPVEERTYWPDDDPDPLKRGRLHEVKRWPTPAISLVTTFLLYDAFGPMQVRNEAGELTVFSRVGGAGRVTRVDSPDGRYVRTRYYDGANPRLVLQSSGAVRRFTYDDKGRLHAVEPLLGDPDAGAVTVGWAETRDHDGAGNTTQIVRSDANGFVRWKQQFEHYPNGELRKMPHPEGKGYARWTRHPNGVPEYYWDEDLHVTRTQADALKRTKQVTFMYSDAVGASPKSLPGGFVYEYEPWQDALSKVSSLTTSAGVPNGVYPVIASYVHDDFGRLLSVSSPYTMTAGPYVYAYDARGNVVKRTGGGAVITYRYDGIDRPTLLTATRSADSSTFSYRYAYDGPSAPGRLHAIEEPDRTTTFSYDEVGRIRFEVVAEAGASTALTTEYVYGGPDGELSDVITPAGLHVKYERDPVTKDVTEVRNLDTGTKYATGVKHLPAGPITDLTFAGGATLSQGYNLRYEPIAIVSGPLALSYDVSGAGLMRSIGDLSFTYDKRDRLERVTPQSTTPYTFVYPYDSGTFSDPAWNAVSDRPAEARGDAGKPRFAFGYDDGSSLSAISPYDAAGTTLTGTTCLVHDALGRLTAVGPAKALASTTSTVCKSEGDLASVTVRFRYDARNRRVARQDGAGPWKQYVFTYSGTLLAEMTKPVESVGTWGVQREYVWLDGRPLAQVEYPGPTANEGYVYLVHVDHLGQPRALTSTAGTIVWSASPPRPYGDMTEATSADPANGRIVVTNLRLPGQYDERLFAAMGLTGLQGPFYNGARWYVPTMARYLELDPVALRGRLNGQFAPDWYGYGNGNPLRWVDPAGEEGIGALIGMVYGGVQGALTARTTNSNWVVGMVSGAAVGFIVGAVDPSLGVGAMMIIGGVGAFTGGAVSGIWGNGPGAWGSIASTNWWGVGGATVGGMIGGAFGGVFSRVGSATTLEKIGEAIVSGGIGALTSHFTEVAATALGNGGKVSDSGRPWTDTGKREDWIRAAGCKP
jgi:RHS repeat-associated protein